MRASALAQALKGDNKDKGARRLIAQELAQKYGLGIWQGNPEPPWNGVLLINKAKD